MITLNGITLNDSLVWEERYQTQGVAQSVRRTLGAAPVISAGALGAGQSITLTAADGMGWFTREVVEQLFELAANPEGVYVLVFNAVEYLVVFRHNEAPAVDMEPIFPRTADEASDKLFGSVKLLTV
jgi:hypothetical protein